MHYSGHGAIRPTQHSSLPYAEHYDTDAALVLLEPPPPPSSSSSSFATADPQQQQQQQLSVRYLHGIELALLLDSLVQKQLRVIVVLDSCHSGSVSRTDAAPGTVRGIPWDEVAGKEFPLLYELQREMENAAKEDRERKKKVKDRVFRDAHVRSHWLLNPRGYGLLTACGPHEVARELDLGGEQWNGALSYHVLEALDFCLRKGIENVSCDVIYRRVASKMYTTVVGQSPVLIGVKETIFIGDDVVQGKGVEADCEVVKVGESGQIWLNAGLVQGVNTGDEYDVHLPGGAEEGRSRVVVTDVQAVQSVAESVLTGHLEQARQPIQVGSFATLEALAQPRAYVKYLFEGDEELDRMLNQSIWLRPLSLKDVAPIDHPHFLVRANKNQQYKIHDSQKEVPNLPSLKLLNGDTKKILLTMLEHLAKFAFIQTLDNKKANSLRESEFAIHAQVKNDPTIVLQDGCIEVTDGSKISVEFRNHTHDILYFTVLNLTPLYKIKKLYPAHKECQAVLPRDLADVLPSVKARELKPSGTVSFRPSANLPERMKVDEGVQIEDVLKFVISNRPIRGTSTMELPELWDLVDASRDPNDSDFAPLGSESFGDTQLRGDQKPVRWAYQSFTVRIVPKKNGKT